MSMIKCKNCGRNISDTEKTCPYCEEKIEKNPNCPKCQGGDVEFSIFGKTGIYECKTCGCKYTVNQKGEAREYVGAKVEDFNIITAFLSIYKKMFDFKGRARRKEYWLAMPLFFVTFVAIYALTFGLMATSDSILTVFACAGVFFVYCILTAIGVLAMEIRRLHDTGRQWHSIFVGCIPLVGRFILLYYYIEDSQFGPNEFGPNPKGME